MIRTTIITMIYSKIIIGFLTNNKKITSYNSCEVIFMSSCKKRKKGIIKNCIQQTVYEVRTINLKLALIGGACAFVLGVLSFIIGGSPTYLLHMLKMPVSLPTRWFFKLSWSAWYFLLGAVFTIASSSCERSKQIYKLQGNMLFIIMMIFNYIWYPLFFGAEAIFLALIACAAVIILSFFVFCKYIKVSYVCGSVMLLHLLWLFYLFCLNAIVLFIN